MNNKVVIGGNLRLKNVVSGQAKLNNVISGTPNTFIRAGGRSGISNAVKEALLDCFEHVAWIDDDGQVYYQALYDALYARTLTSITAVFEQGQAVIYDDDTLDDLKQYLTVTANYDDGTSAIITTYTLSGTLNPGTSSIQVSYENKKAYFNVTVMHRPGVVTITNTLNGCTTSNNASSMTEGDPYTATITADSHYTLTGASVSITMGGVDITSSAYSNGTISIAEVTGSLVITITAVAVTLASIGAVYTQSGTVYENTALNDLKTDLVVTATYSDSSTVTVPSTDYTLSGTLTEGTSTITVSYEGKTTTFNVTVSPKYVYYDYLQGDETAFVDTGLLASIYGSDNYKKHVKFRIGSTTKEKAVFGARNAWQATGIYAQTAQSYFAVLFGNEVTNIGSFAVDELVEIDLDYPDLKVNGTSVKTVTSPTTQITFAAMTYPLFAAAGGQRPTSAYVSYNGGYVFQFSNHKIYEFTITDKTTGDVVANMIPAMDTDTMTAGMYDTVRETFYSNARSTGTLTLGNDED